MAVQLVAMLVARVFAPVAILAVVLVAPLVALAVAPLVQRKQGFRLYAEIAAFHSGEKNNRLKYVVDFRQYLMYVNNSNIWITNIYLIGPYGTER